MSGSVVMYKKLKLATCSKLTDPGDIANTFNHYFINIGRQLSDKIQSPHHYSDYLHNQVESHLKLKPISEIDISNIINNLKVMAMIKYLTN